MANGRQHDAAGMYTGEYQRVDAVGAQQRLEAGANEGADAVLDHDRFPPLVRQRQDGLRRLRSRVHERAFCSRVLAPLTCGSVNGACAKQIRQSLSILRLAAHGSSLEVAITWTEPVRRTRTQFARQFEHRILINFCVVNFSPDTDCRRVSYVYF
jgi:hypothetical protein